MSEPTSKRRVALIIPAYNEEQRIGKVLDAAVRCELADEIVVVCDGSTDHTADVASLYAKVKVVDLQQNVGKAGAMAMGVANCESELICFVDADLSGLRPEHIVKIVTPVILGHCDMCIGIFRGGKFLSDSAQRVSPYLSGQRCCTREFFESIPFLAEMRFGIEVTMNTLARRQRLRVQRVVLHGLSNNLKERKFGIVKGATARAKMYAEIGRAMVRLRRKEAKRHAKKKIR